MCTKAPDTITAYLSVASKAAGFAVAMRIFVVALGEGLISNDWAIMFAAIAAISMTVGNVAALAQSNIKRMLGYSSIAQAGNFLIGLAAVAAKDPQLPGHEFGSSSSHVRVYEPRRVHRHHRHLEQDRLGRDQRLRGHRQAFAVVGRRSRGLPDISDRHPANRGIRGQAVRLQRGGPGEPNLAGGCWRFEQRDLFVLLPSRRAQHVRR
jgi:hypothetical protein